MTNELKSLKVEIKRLTRALSEMEDKRNRAEAELELTLHGPG